METNHKVWDWRTIILKHGPDNATYRHVLLTLSCYMNSAGSSCFPSIKELCSATKLGKTSIIKYLEKGSEEGWIEKSVHGFSGQGWKRNQYAAQVPKKVVHEMNRVSKGGSPGEQGGSRGEPKVVHEVNTNSPYNSTTNSPKSARVNGVPVPAQLAAIEDFIKKYQFYCRYMQENFSRWPNLTTTEVDLQQLLMLHQKGNPPKAVIDQTIQARNKSFYPLRDFEKGDGKNFDATGRANASAYQEFQD